MTAVDVADLPDGVNVYTAGGERVQHARRRFDGIVAAIGGPRETAGLADERTSDHPVHVVRSDQHFPGPLAPIVERLDRDDPFVGGHLKDRVGRRIEDRATRLHVLVAEFVDDLGARGGHVAQRRLADDRGERVDHVLRETLRIGRERDGRDDARHLPMTGDRILAAAPLAQSGDLRGRPGGRRDPLDRR